MADLLKKHLKEKCERPALSMLESQWGFDEKLIPKALQTIGVLFPHYSRHDESHSKQILVNIERLLGENIKLLSATDIWLLLEAAYWHDIGMVVPWEDKKAAFNSQEFQDFLSEIAQDSKHDLCKFARALRGKAASGLFAEASTPVEAVDQVTYLMAEWFRYQHANRASQIVNSPMEAIGLSSPRTELIPARLFRVLGRICEMHGRSFAEIMAADGLPFREAGLGQDDCHPRYIACLLRLGDLLDLDDNRFCPVMQQIAGDGRPALSRAHEEKHLAIRHLRVDRERIEVKAECHTLDSYSETCKWFDWLALEIQMQMANWQEIVPDRELGLLPTLGTLDVSMNGEFQILKKGQRPEFSIDSGKAYELIRGANLYPNKFDYIREALQNAVDATLLALWVRKNSFSEVDWSTPESARAVLKHATINVQLEERGKRLCDDTGATLQTWVLTIEDEGTGISFDDLEYIRRIGASQKNKQRQKIIETMPEWMRPSGAFGIGIHSVFMVAPMLSLDTKSIFDNECIEISLYSPSCKENGLFMIKKLPVDVFRKPGTTLSIEMLLPVYKESGFAIRQPIHRAVAQNFDPLFEDDYPHSIEIADYVVEFFSRTVISCVGRVVTKRHGVIGFSNGFSDSDKVVWDYIEVGEGIIVGIVLEEISRDAKRSRKNSRFNYRGQSFDFPSFFQSAPRESELNIRFNVMFGRADEWLTADRSRVALSAADELRHLLYVALQKKIRKDDYAGDNEERRKQLSLFLADMAVTHGGEWSSISREFGDQWQKIVFTRGNFSELLRSDEWSFARHLGSEIDQHIDLVALGYSENIERIVFSGWLDGRKANGITALSCQEYLGKEVCERLSESHTPNYLVDLFQADAWKTALVYRMHKFRRDPYTLDALKIKLSSMAATGYGNKRFLLPLSKYFKVWGELAVNQDVLDKFPRVFDNVRNDHPHILLPFLFKKIHATGVIQYQASYDNVFYERVRELLQKDLSFEQVRGLYAKLIECVDEVMSDVDDWKNYRED
ncbi:hypothetical protein [Pseudomonas sp. MWU13-3659]|uniref:HD domain-containing protein n=1 Tax=Pseudomonas sp. MWU13-3659 TaxID=2986964 RepID=UPI002074CDA7|nr:hypothetical protein [Pseudomonas sp. MWU13-3659]